MTATLPTAGASGAAFNSLRAGLQSRGLSPDRAALVEREIGAAADEATARASGDGDGDAAHDAMAARIDADQAVGLLSADEAAAAHAAIDELARGTNVAVEPSPTDGSTLDRLLGLLEDTQASRSERVNVARFLKRMVDDGLIDITA